MTFTVNIQGHDDLEAELKQAFEEGLVAKVVELVGDIKEDGVTISTANVTTNTTGPVDALAATEGNAQTADAAAGEESEPAPAEDDLGDTPEE